MYSILKLSLSTLLLCSIATVTLAQVTLSGIITDAGDQTTIIGANVETTKGSNGTVTDIDGYYALDAAADDTLVISYIGYTTQYIPVAARSQIDVALEQDNFRLNEVVVVGYGRQKKRLVSGAISTVTEDEINSTPVLRVEQALQGRTPGVQVTNQSGQPGDEPTVRVRGVGTTGNARPLYIVDGMPVGGIDYLNPGDIESMDVLKDAASAAIYGARAANGVILITTKGGRPGKLNVSYDGYYGVQNTANRLDMLNADQYRALMNDGARNAGLTEPFDLNEISTVDTDWQDALFTANAPIQNHQLSVTGGNAASTYAASVSYFSQEGIIGGSQSQFDRYTARVNSNHKVNKVFSFGNTLSYTHLIKRGIATNASFNGIFSSALNMDPLTPVYETDEDVLQTYPYSVEPVVTDDQGTFGISNYVGAEVTNPLARLALTNQETRKDELVGSVFAAITPIKNLEIKTNLGINLAYVLDDGFSPLFFLNGAQLNDNQTTVNKSIERYYTWNWENTINYTFDVDDHSFGILGGVTANAFNFENLTGFNAGVPVTDPDNVYLNLATDTLWRSGGGARHASLYSLFGRATYSYQDKYSVTGILRRDGSSRFGANERFGIFPSIGVAWVMSDEDFIRDRLGDGTYIKARASWGVNGNQEIGDYQFVSIIDQTRGYTFGGGREVGSSPLFIENNDIRWEQSEQIDLGLDMGFFENRLQATLGYYVKTTKGLLERIPIPGHVGNGGPIANVGSVQNRGVELSLNYRNKINNIKYSFGVNGGYNQNRMLEIGNEEGVIGGASWALAGAVTRTEENLPIAYFWGFKTDGLFQNQTEIFRHLSPDGEVLQPNAVPGDVRFVDINNDGIINEDDRTIIGNPTPDFTFGINASVEVGNFDFSMFWNGQYGNEIFNGSQRQDLRFTNRTTAALDRWTGEGTSTETPRYTWVDANNNYRVSDLYIEDGSFIRLKNMQVGYTLPAKLLNKMGAEQWRFYLSGENLLTLTNYTGADPEIGSFSSFDIGIDRGIYPQAIAVRLGTNLTF